MGFRFTPLAGFPDVITIDLDVHRDRRGWFSETFSAETFASAGISGPFAQDDHALSRGHVLRGLHYQLEPVAQGKLVRCIAGRVFDVTVDLRRGSPTFGHHATVVLDGAAPRALWIPPGFAHGYLTLGEESEVLYRHTRPYSAAHARRIRWNDEDLGIRWPLTDEELIISADDAAAPLLRDAEINFRHGHAER